jgi:hypothetical protein
VDGSRNISEFKTFRDVIEKLIVPKITGGMFTDKPIEPANSSRKSFTTTRGFYAETMAIYLNGVRQDVGDDADYITSGNRTVVFKIAPTTGDKILIDFVPMDV